MRRFNHDMIVDRSLVDERGADYIYIAIYKQYTYFHKVA